MRATALVAVLSSASVFAQVAAPKAGQLLQQLAPTPMQPRGGKNLGVEPPSPASNTAAAAGDATVMLKSIRFTGNKKINDATLRRAVPQIDQLLGQTVGFAQLDGVAAAVTHYYRERGYFIAMAYVPHQTVEDGIITIAVLEGRLGQSRLGHADVPNAQQLQKYQNDALCGRPYADCVGVVLTRAHADRAVGLVSKLPGVASASGTLSPGDEVGTSDYTLDVVPAPAFSGTLGFDSYGNEYTGRVRETGSVRWNDPTGSNDLFTAALAVSDRQGLSGTTGRGAFNAVFDYSTPLGYDGMRVGASYTRLMYRLGAPFDETNSYGSGNAYSAYVTYPVIIAPGSNLTVRGSYGTTRLSDSVLGNTYHPQDNAATLGVYGDQIDTLWRGGAIQYGLTLSRGRIDYGSGSLPIAAPNAAGDYDKVNLYVSRDQTLAYVANGTQRISVYGSLQGQWTDANLDPVDQMSLGGPGGVRGYPVGEATGDQGAIATVELRDSFALQAFGGQSLTVSLFRDNGLLTLSHSPWPGYQGALDRNLGSTGLGVDLLSQSRYNLKAMWAIRDAGGERDTSTQDSRSWLWFQAQIFF